MVKFAQPVNTNKIYTTDYTAMILEWKVGLKQVGHFGEYGALSVGGVRQNDKEMALGSELVIEDRGKIVADVFS
ncbi:MAG: hypothetical protein OXT74_02535 [Candidatus Poribacteria bacterium]|nr:hypothetical protein [Candidatus Poribacteria bacterium]